MKPLINNCFSLPVMSLSLTHVLEGINLPVRLEQHCICYSTNYTSSADITLQDLPTETLHILERATQLLQNDNLPVTLVLLRNF